MAYPPNSTAAYALEAAISANKLDRSKITLLPLRPAEMVAAWKRGDIDAGYVWAPFAQELESSGGHQVFATKDLQKDGYLIYNNYVVRKAFAEQYPGSSERLPARASAESRRIQERPGKRCRHRCERSGRTCHHRCQYAGRAGVPNAC